MKFGSIQSYEMNVQFEDVDMGGAVHNPNYLKFYERARNFHLNQNGVSTADLISEGHALVIAEIHIKYLSPIFLEQKINVKTQVLAANSFALKVEQTIQASDNLEKILNRAIFKIVFVSLAKGKPVKFTTKMIEALHINTAIGNTDSNDISIP